MTMADKEAMVSPTILALALLICCSKQNLKNVIELLKESADKKTERGTCEKRCSCLISYSIWGITVHLSHVQSTLWQL